MPGWEMELFCTEISRYYRTIPRPFLNCLVTSRTEYFSPVGLRVATTGLKLCDDMLP